MTDDPPSRPALPTDPPETDPGDGAPPPWPPATGDITGETPGAAPGADATIGEPEDAPVDPVGPAANPPWPPATPHWTRASPQYPPPGFGPWAGAPPAGWPPALPRSAFHLLFTGLGGVVLGVVLAIALVVVLDVTEDDSSDESFFGEEEFGPWMNEGMAEPYDTTSAAATVEPMDCLTDDDLLAAEATKVDCEEAHSLEVYVRRPALQAEDAAYPTDELDFFGVQVCLMEFEPYVSAAYEDSSLDYVSLVPSREAWDDGERDIVCALYDMEESSLEGTSKGSGR